jgi:hypothetical protein
VRWLRARLPEVFTTWLEELRSRFADRILPVDARVAEQWGRPNTPAERKAIDSLTLIQPAHGHPVNYTPGLLPHP